MQQRATHHRLQLVEIEQLAQNGGINGRHFNRKVRALRLSERPRRRELLPLEKLTQLCAAEVIKIVDSIRHALDRHPRAVVPDGNETNEFVVWSLGVELD